MNDLFSYTLAALLSIAVSPFLFRGKMPFPMRGAILFLVLFLFEIFVWLAFSKEYPHYEILPFRMFALCLCFSTLFLSERSRFFGVLATVLWLWVDFFGMLSLSYRGVEFRAIPLLFIAVSFLPFLEKSPRREIRFLTAVLWAFAWTFSFVRVL